ncbi:MBL fold metallo-hydrolase [Corynebacterium cystitidis]|uniref:L-ascorbate metabolism protein UlaG, beta-lactamase superfamily n=1 Tax=Corynebacterium cystitidis DSM 20524 TaxID=1121357 RepID=A0A1H9QV88_9CORY|nr:MBL fold metallo-hydrolase [Corynebacterium cystitidis]WJY81658.1 metal-dependent hydrolase [Corynebacterium cystitidis DSM 20524]SER64145.1 L-ascorbate metabolism protein UlaG, beta-lactamase superfamily [Corynebacterium cystitidis DSM 20524]SNV85231.1 putative Zn-dependent hydrolase [Corynebacterium cystitidis]
MKLTLLGHSTVALEVPEGRIVIDPGNLTDNPRLDEAQAILITHLHPDHCDVDQIKNSGLPVWGPQAVIDELGTGTIVQSGDTINVLGQEIRCVGKIHEVIHPDLPRPENIGYFVDGILHPGDEFIHIDGVETLLMPIACPWVKAEYAAEWAKHIGAHTTYPIHDEVLSHKGRNLYDNVYKNLQVPGYQRLAHGVTVEA